MSMSFEPTPNSQPNPAPQIDQLKYDHFMQQIRENQNLGMAIVGGLIAALAGAGIWGGVSYLTGYQIGWMAIGIGFLVGLAVRKMGDGIDKSFGIIGAVFSLFGCLAGNLFSSCIYISVDEGIELFDVFRRLDMDLIIEIYKVTFSPIDILFYGFAIYYGYKYSFRQITDEELKPLLRQG